MESKKKYNRRAFIRQSAISGISLGLSPNPLQFFHPEEVVFSRYKDTRIFLPPNGYKNEQVFIYTDETYSENTFSMVRAFGGTALGSRFAVVFYKLPLDFSRQQTLSDIENIGPNIKAEKTIVWIDELSDAELAISFSDTCIRANTKNEVKKLPVGFGHQLDYGFYLEQLNVVSKVSFDAVNNNLLIYANGNDEAKLTVNDRIGNITQIEIPLFNSSNTKLKSGVKNPGGSIRFGINKFKDNLPILPVSPYLFQTSAQVKIHNIGYFDPGSVIANATVIVTFFPYRIFSNSEDKVTSLEYDLPLGKKIKTKFLNQYGKNFYIRNTANFLCRLAMVSYDANVRYIFIPGGHVKLETLKNRVAELLLGYSGTERLRLTGNGLEVSFLPSNLLKINVQANALTADPHSITAQLWFNPVTYCLDSDKSPSFDNSNTKYTTSATRKVPYLAVEMGKIPRPSANKQALPVIPSLSFSDPSDVSVLQECLEMDKIFVKHRLSLVHYENQHLPDEVAFVNPSGFLQKGNNYDYIKEDVNIKLTSQSDLRPVLPGHEKYRFKLLNSSADLDFRLSIAKDDVFFVTTPKLLAQLTHVVDFNIFFSLHGFDANLIFKENTAGNDEDRIVIFKYSRLSINELAQHTDRWSNYGKFAPGPQGQRSSLASLQAALVNQFKKLDLAAAGNKDGDYDYINKTVRADGNWNGVLVLNIPFHDEGDLPPLFTGLTASQHLQPVADGTVTEKLKLSTPMNMKYVAFPINKTFVNDKKVIDIKTTSFYGLIDYDIVLSNKKGADYAIVLKHLSDSLWKFVLGKLLIRFENNEIKNFKSIAFIRIMQLFDDSVSFKGASLSTADDTTNDTADPVENMLRLEGHYQKNAGGGDEFNFDIRTNLIFKFEDSSILDHIELRKAAFSCVGNTSDHYRFDFDGEAVFKKDLNTFKDFISFDGISFQNIGISFQSFKFGLPKINFDITRLFVLPKIGFNFKGFLNSFPVKFKRFAWFNVKDGEPENFDYLKISDFKMKFPSCTLFGFVFDFDLGTLGDLGMLSGLKAELIFGWAKGGGFKLGLKLGKPASKGLHIDLFGALKLDVESIELCQLQGQGQYFLSLVDVKLTILGLQLPKEPDKVNGFLFAGKATKTAWLVSYVKDNKIALAVGQRISLAQLKTVYSVASAFNTVRGLFTRDFKLCENGVPEDIYSPESNWLVASESLISKDWTGVFDFQFIFNDPVLYGALLNLIGLFSIDILYKKLSDDLGLWSIELALDPSIRTIDAGELVITLPNIGIDISTKGDWRLDVGFPKADDWARSCLIQLRPYVGWAGVYISGIKSVELSLFGPYKDLLPTDGKPGSLPGSGVSILQTGFAVRVGIGAYLDKGIYYVGASISVYGIMEGAFAFNKTKENTPQLFPKHFALFGRVGAIAELVGYVDFKIVKAAIHIILQVELGMLLAFINGKLQPAPLYISGRVIVSIDFTIACFKVFGHKICINIHLSFQAEVSFNYTIGGGSATAPRHLLPKVVPNVLEVKELCDIPYIFMPSFTRSFEGTKPTSYLICNFGIPFFGLNVENGKLKVPKKNILKDGILMPIFAAIEANFGKLHYEELRCLLLKKKLHETDPSEIEFSFPNFRPLFLLRFEFPTASSPEYDKFLKDHFLLHSDPDPALDELGLFYQHVSPQPCNDNAVSLLYRTIPAPISPKIKVQERGAASWGSDKGFSVNVKGMFADNSEAICPILPDQSFSENQFKQLEDEFTQYKTQFDNRSKAETNHFQPKSYELRDEVAVQEYFRLLALMALEIYYSSLTADADTKLKGTFNPVIDSVAVLKGLNEKIETLIGQVNYFYNNGLRFKDLGDATGKTYISYFSFMKQAVPVTPLTKAAAVVYDDVHFSLISADDPGNKSELKSELFCDKDAFIADFIGSGKAMETLNPATLLDQFKAALVMPPYKLIPVKLAISNIKSDGEDENLAFRFFNVPKTICSFFNKERTCVLNLKVAETKYPDHISPIKATVCSNVGFRVKCCRSNDLTYGLEFSSVEVDDLNLMNLVKTYGKDLIKKINVYQESNQSLKMLPHDGLTMVKTNISPKTHPPVIIDPKFLMAKAPDVTETYYADISNNQADFIRLFWEALTTNNGGYYLTVNPPKTNVFQNFKDPKFEYTLIMSFEMTEYGMIAAANGFNNAVKVMESQVIPDLLSGLDKQRYYLYAEVMMNKADADGQFRTPLKEYHAKIPSHCFSFELERAAGVDNSGTKPKTAIGSFLQYIPIDFTLTDHQSNVVVVDKEGTLPIMPKNKEDQEDWSKIYYQHLTPLIQYDGNNDLNKYNAVGRKFDLSFFLRDIYGFRLGKIPVGLSYTHVYFDKLIPVNAWPLIKFFYWMDVSKGSPSWILRFAIDGNAIAKPPVVADSLSDQQKHLLKIKSQVLDDRYKLFITNEDADNHIQTIAIKDDQKESVIKIINAALRATGLPLKDNEVQNRTDIPFTLDIGIFKTVLNPQLKISRGEDESLFASLPPLTDSGEVWDYNSIKRISVPIPLSKGEAMTEKKILNPAAQLNDEIQLKWPDYAIGSGTVKGDHVQFLINISSIRTTFQGVNFTPANFLAVRPYTTKAWSGNYEPVEKTIYYFREVDLDQSLKIVLTKVDEMLDGLNASYLPLKECVNSLVISKRKLVKGTNLISEDADVSAELSNRVEAMNVSGAVQCREFENILLEKLSNYYDYDGILNTAITPSAGLAGHRLSLGLLIYEPVKDDPGNRYQAESSKLDFRDGQNRGWQVLFNYKKDDLQTPNAFYNFSFTPQVTHIEYNIGGQGDTGNGIEKSEWIQLIKPFNLTRYDVKNFPVTYRNCPPNPLIILNKAIQSNTDAAIQNWGPGLGDWKYRLGIKNDPNYRENDKIYINLEFRVTNPHKFQPDNKRNFPGFIAYWSQQISQGALNLDPGQADSGTKIATAQKFAKELEEQLNKDYTGGEVFPMQLVQTQNSLLLVLFKAGNVWKVDSLDFSAGLNSKFYVSNANGEHLKKNSPVDDLQSISFGGMNLFLAPHIVSVKPRVWVTRNENVNNPNFKYLSDVVTPTNWTTIHLKFMNAIYVNSNKLQDVFKVICEPQATGNMVAKLPFKSTFKHLLNTGDLLHHRGLVLSSLSLSLLEFPAGSVYAANADDRTLENEDLEDYENGYPAVSLMIGNPEPGEDNDLPVFSAVTIFKMPGNI